MYPASQARAPEDPGRPWDFLFRPSGAPPPASLIPSPARITVQANNLAEALLRTPEAVHGLSGDQREQI
ncbi:hypothetical protein WOLCODRAFT_156820 [Wolfiporia cocos MD-104 SS10]|uniref:Uncharacterized protein n=1 Tax=Wolfiporia cocos (strain MD-104) TaxID=742152 RepID=A0A2H3JJD8_WOLCO|nr:hypothetical protein WOLCODRAFT_156820 [Wolfiporia cocos MD-104 SS10]